MRALTAVAALCAAFATLPSTAQAQITWTGTGVNANWATAGNWGSATAPANNFNTSLVFAGTNLLSNTNTLTGGTATGITFDSTAGAFVLGGNLLTLTGNITNNSSNLQTLALNLDLRSNVRVSGSSNITISGLFTNSGANRTLTSSLDPSKTLTFSGTTALQESGTGVGRTLTLAGTGNTTFSGPIVNGGTAGNSVFTITNTGTTLLTGANTYTGATNVNAGTLQLGNGGTTGGLSSSSNITVLSGATLVFNRSDDYGGNFANLIAGGGNITLLSGSLTPANSNNSYTGQTTVSGGVLIAGVATKAFGNTAPLALNSGTVNLNGFSQTIAALSGSAGTLITTSAATGTATLTANFASGTSTFAGSIANNGSGVVNFTKAGAGTQILSGSNSFGVLTVNAGGGQVSITGTTSLTGGAFSQVSSNLVVSGNGQLNTPSGNAFQIHTTSGTATAIFQDSAVVNIGNSIGVGTAGASSRSLVTIKDSANVSGATVYVGNNAGSVGGVLQSGGSVSVAYLYVANVSAGSGGASGYYALSGGTLTTSTNFRIGGGGPANMNGVFQQSGGSVTAQKELLVRSGTSNDPSTSYGTYFMTSGTLTGSGALTMTIGQAGGQGDFTLNGGTVNLGANGVNLANLLTGVPSGTGILNLNGGSLQAGSITGLSGTGTSLLNFAGGTLKANGATTTFVRNLALATISGSYSSGGVTYAGGATIDTNGVAITIPQSLLAPSGNGVAVDSFTSITGLIGAPYVLVVGTGTGATAQAIYDSSTGSMTGITVTNPGSGYTGTPTFQIFGGGLSGTTTVNATTFANTSGGLTKINSGTLTLSGTNTYTGQTTVNGGVLAAGIANAFGSSAPLAVNSGTVNLGGFSQSVGALSGSAGTLITTSTGAGSATLTTTFASGTFEFAGSITNNVSGTVAFTKAGAGTLTLNGVNSYTGATTVTAGQLQIGSAGSINTSSGITINGATAEFKYNSATALTKPITFTAGTLSGTGTIGTAVTVGTSDILSPGNSPGSQSFTSGLTFAPGGKYVWEINNWTSGSAGTNYDQLVVSGSVLNITAQATSGSTFTIALTSLTAGNVAGAVPGFSGTAGTSFTIATSSAGIAGFDKSKFSIDQSAFTNTLPTNAGFWLSTNGGSTSLILNYAPSATYNLSAAASATAIRVGGTSTITATVTSSTAALTNPDTMSYAGLALSGSAGALSSTSGTLNPGGSSSGNVAFIPVASGSVTFSPSVTSATNVTLATNANAGTTSGVTVSVYNPASATSLTGTTVVLTNVHVGQSFGTQSLSISNTGTAAANFQEGLAGSYTSATGAASGSGSFSNLFTGSASTAISVGLGNASTASAGVKSGTVTLGFTSTGTTSSGATGLDLLTLTSQTVAVTGTVFNYAAASSVSGTIDFGTVLKGTTLSQAISITNTAPAGSYSEKLDAAFNSFTGSASGTGVINVLTAGVTSAALSVSLASGSAGAIGGTAVIGFTSNGAGTSDLGTTSLDPQTVNLVATVLDPATASFVSGATSTTLDLNFGELNQGSGDQSRGFNLYNLAGMAGYTADLALLSITGSSGNTSDISTNLATFNNLASGSSSAWQATISTANTGLFSNTYTLNFASAKNGASLGGSQSMTLTVRGIIVVPEPGAIALAGIGIGLAGWAAKRRRRRAS